MMLQQAARLGSRALSAATVRSTVAASSARHFSTETTEEPAEGEAAQHDGERAPRSFTIPSNPPTFAHVQLSGYLTRKPFVATSPNNRKYARITVGVRARLPTGRFTTNHYPVLVFDEDVLARLSTADTTTAVIVDGSLRVGDRPATTEGRYAAPNYVIVADRLLMWTGRARKEGDFTGIPAEGAEAPAGETPEGSH